MDEDEKGIWVSWLWPMSLIAMWCLAFRSVPGAAAVFWIFTTLFAALSIAWLFRVTYLKGRGGNR